ncbi:TPA: hypothetical protein ACH3X3_013455 [Trebouxia sp. C0006]
MHLCSVRSPRLSRAGHVVGSRPKHSGGDHSKHTAFRVIKTMGVDPQIKAFLANQSTVSYDTLTPEEARSTAVKLLKATKVFDVKTVLDTQTTGPRQVSVRWYVPEYKSNDALPVIVYFHGGGWVTGDLDVFDALCRALAHHSRVHVVSVGYSLAPEHNFPEGLEDAYAATLWASEHAADFGADPSRIAVAGDSAGGNFSAAVSILARDRFGPKLSLQILLYPVTDYESDQTGHSESFKQNKEGYYLTAGKMEWYWKQYLQDPVQCKDPLVSVLHANDLTKLPPAVVVTAEFDLLRDQGKAYADKLKAAGVSVQYKCYPGQIHSFMGFAVTQYGTDVGLQALADVGQQVQEHYSTKQPD